MDHYNLVYQITKKEKYRTKYEPKYMMEKKQIENYLSSLLPIIMFRTG
jgi:hypothetical protein